MLEVLLFVARIAYVIIFFFAIYITFKFEWGSEGKDERGRSISQKSYSIVFPLIAYGVMVGYQFLPVLKDEFVQIGQAHRLRGAAQEKNALQRLLGIRRILIPTLAGAVRKAERAAFAMEARGFTGERRSSYFHVITVGKVDVALVSLFFVVLFLSCTNMWWLTF